MLISGFAMPAYAAMPTTPDNMPQLNMDLASINMWKPEIPLLTPRENTGDTPEFVADMISYAHEFMGLRYRRGGKTPKGFDCSGFTSYIYRQFGVSLHASSRSQYTQGNEVKEGDLRPGDLVFFGGRGGSKRIVGHVGIVTAVDGDSFDFIHSATSSGITVSKSTEPYYSRRYIGARRVAE